jgi:hypothetical protein
VVELVVGIGKRADVRDIVHGLISW